MLHRGVFTTLVAATLASCLFASTLSQFRPFQPATIDPDPIVSFLEKDQHERWRFLTLGFGDQMAWLSAQTTATQVDGNYHSVRRLPELTSTSVERLEGAKYRGVSGLGSLQQFLEVPEKYHLKFVFSNDTFYDPLLHFLGWQEVGPLENGIVVWEKNDIAPLPAVLPVNEVPVWQRLMWGIVPATAITVALILLAWQLLGRRSSCPPNDDAETAILFGPFAMLDRWLERRLGSAEAPAGPPLPPRAHRPRSLEWVRDRLGRSISRPGQFVRLGTLAVLVLVPTLTFTFARSSDDPGPVDVVATYYDHLDFREWRAAYDLLDPQTRPDYELWRLQVSVEGGLLASYAKLDSFEAALAETDSGRPLAANEAMVLAELRYLTALDWYSTERSHVMVERDGGWFLRPEPTDITLPPEQLVRRTSVDYLIQGRRRVTSLTSELTDIQDRPRLVVRGARLVEHEGLPVVVGEVRNIDVDPADLTITAVLRDADGNQLARYNATDHLKRTLNPRESTPFRIDFEEVAAGTDVDFDPLDFSPIRLDDEIASVEVYAKAVVTQKSLYRGLQVNDVAFGEPTDDGWSLAGEIRNDGVVEAVVPMVLVSFLDDSGEVRWVERFFLDTAIRSQRSRDFAVDLEVPQVGSAPGVEVSVFANGLDRELSSDLPPLDLLAPPEGSPFTDVRIDVVTMLPPGAES